MRGGGGEWGLTAASFEESGESMEITAGIDESHFGHVCCGVNKLTKRDVFEVELAADANHVSVEIFFDEGAVSANAELATEDDVEGVGGGTARLVAELDAHDFFLFLGALAIAFGDLAGQKFGEFDAAELDVAELVAGGVAEEGLGQKFG